MPGIPNKIKIIQFGNKNNYWYKTYSLNSKSGRKEYKEPSIIIDNVFDQQFKIKNINFYRKIIQLEYQKEYTEFKCNKPLFTLELTSFISYMDKYGINKGSMIDGNKLVCVDNYGLSIVFKESELYKSIIEKQNDLYHAKRLYKFEQGGIYQNKYEHAFLCLDAKEKRFIQFDKHKQEISELGLKNLNFNIEDVKKQAQPKKETWSGKLIPGYLEYFYYNNTIVKTPRVYLQNDKLSKEKLLNLCIKHYNTLMAKIESYGSLVEIYKKENGFLNYDINTLQCYKSFLILKNTANKMNEIINKISNQS